MTLDNEWRKNPKWFELVELVKNLSYLKAKNDEFTLASGRRSSHFLT